MRQVSVNLTIERETQKAYLTKEAGWLPKSAIVGMVGDDVIVEIALWIVEKNEQLKENAIRAKTDNDNFNKEYFGTTKPSTSQIMTAIAEQEEAKGNKWNPIKKIWE